MIKVGYWFSLIPAIVIAATASPRSDSTRGDAAPAPSGIASASLSTPRDTSTPDSTGAPKDGVKPTAAKPALRTSTRTIPRTKRVPFEAVTLGVRHRVFHEFRDLHRVKLNEEFPLGDSDYSARVAQYLPDFQMDLATRRFFSISDQPNNPAFKLIVRKGKVPQDTTWAFLNNPPHFGAKSYFAFQVVKVELAGRAPLLPDTTSGLFKPGGPAPGSAPAFAPLDSARKP